LSRKDLDAWKPLKPGLPAMPAREVGETCGVKTKLPKAFDDFFHVLGCWLMRSRSQRESL
jgi:hypothetical protein